MKAVWVYDNSWAGPTEEPRRIGDDDWIKIFATREDADRWLAANDPEGVVWQYPVEHLIPPPRNDK